ncbi:restriction endonuclease [Hymenobacter profundi]|uniref:Restriction endonuclease n=1 Tax=Hymenobacter profundi TaxID=1982110 RepID=A0ABS6X067_9BACT|nr:restriction endonuclease [Hymenobacter profundi]
MQQWRALERLVALLTAVEYQDNLLFTVIPNARIKGHLSGYKRQIDVLVDYRYGTDIERRIIFDAKDKKRPIDVKEVEAFEGLMRDVQAKRGFLVCTNGHTKAALNRAQDHIGIRLIMQEDIESLNLSQWVECMSETCKFGLVLWDYYFYIQTGGMIAMHAVGKCDGCGKFHVWCWDCGEQVHLEKEDHWQCLCEPTWSWLSSSKTHETLGEPLGKSIYLLLLHQDTSYNIIDRRPL